MTLKQLLGIARALRILSVVSIFCLVCAGARGQAQPPSAYPTQIITYQGALFGVCDVYQVALSYGAEELKALYAITPQNQIESKPAIEAIEVED